MSAGVPARRLLVVNADDFGQSDGTTNGIIRAHEHGIVTSASLMVRWPTSARAAAYGRAHPHLSVGLHLDLGEWKQVDGRWVEVYRVVAPDDAEAVALEILDQCELFRTLLGRDPTHVDSHQHAHLKEPAKQVVLDLAARLDVPVRHCCAGIRYAGGFYGQSAAGAPLPHLVEVDALRALIRGLPAGMSELGCHPATEVDLDTMYGRERLTELVTLCDPAIRAELDACDVGLVSFADVPATR